MKRDFDRRGCPGNIGYPGKKIHVPQIAPEFPIGNGLKSDPFLHGYGISDGSVFQFRQLFPGKFFPAVCLPGRQQFRRPQQTAYMISTVRWSVVTGARIQTSSFRGRESEATQLPCTALCRRNGIITLATGPSSRSRVSRIISSEWGSAS